MKWFLMMLLMTVSCDEGEKDSSSGGDNTDNQPTETSENSGDQTATTAEELEEMKEEIERLKESNKQLASKQVAKKLQTKKSQLKADADGWAITAGIGRPIAINALIVARVDFDDTDADERMDLTLSGCDEIKTITFFKRNGEEIISNTMTGRVGSPFVIMFYRANGEITAPDNPCTLKASVIDDSDESIVKSKTKTITIEAGTIGLSQLQDDNSMDIPFFRNKDNSRIALSVMTQGIDDDNAFVLLYKEQNNEYRFFGSAMTAGLPSDGEFDGELCEVLVSYDNNEIQCQDNVARDRWATTIPTGNYLLLAVDNSFFSGVELGKFGLLETDE